MTTSLTTFLLARIAEDERRTVGYVDEDRSSSWHALGCGLNDDPGTWCECAVPARVLAECAAKRAILDALEDERQRKDIYNRGYDAGDLTTSGDLRNRLASNARWAGLDLAARYMVQVYSSHPHFLPEWLPENW